jgi:hypothetical protein
MNWFLDTNSNVKGHFCITFVSCAPLWKGILTCANGSGSEMLQGVETRRTCRIALPEERLKNIFPVQVLVAHACNPSYSGGRDQEDRSSKPAWANSS